MAAFLNLLSRSKPAQLASFYRRAPNAAGGLFCGARMTCPTDLHEVVSIHPYNHPVNGNGNHSTCVSDHFQVIAVKGNLLISLTLYFLKATQMNYETLL